MNETVERPWGRYTVIEEAAGYKVKRMEIKPFQRVSLQRHKIRNETWTVILGKAKVVKGEKEILLNVNDSVLIPKNTIHRIENIGNTLLRFIEVQTGQYLGEDDEERLEDDYGRKGTREI